VQHVGRYIVTGFPIASRFRTETEQLLETDAALEMIARNLHRPVGKVVLAAGIFLRQSTGLC
jgi:hypothetical protein